jgi:3-phenylpropionate/cinnamic acid dioxygenase small subunit
MEAAYELKWLRGECVMTEALTYASEHRELRLQFEDIFSLEAALLDANRLTEWLELLDEKIRYRVPSRTDRDRGSEDFDREGLLCHIDDDKATLAMRAQRAQTGAGWAEQPPPRVRHFVSNVRIVRAEPHSVDVTSNFIVFRSHVGLPDHSLSGCRHDRWILNGSAWRLRDRLVILDQNVFQGMAVLF